MNAPGSRSLYRRLLRGVGFVLFQLVLVLLYALHRTRAAGSPFRAGLRPFARARRQPTPMLRPA